jgi:hypothetical protein
MKKKRTRAAVDAGPSKQSVRDIPEVDFSRGVRPHRYARLQSGYKNQVFVDPEIFEFFGSSDAINDALRFLVKAAARGAVRPRSKARSTKAA